MMYVHISKDTHQSYKEDARERHDLVRDHESVQSMELHINELSHLPDFIRLNHEWIERYFELEESDRNLATAPEQVIVDGGSILSITDDKRVVGVCALFKKAEGYELARMAVCDSAKGNGYGRKLMEAALSMLNDVGADKVRLYSNTKLEPAISLYKSYGFETIFEGQHPDYARCNIIMEKPIRNMSNHGVSEPGGHV